MAGNGNSATSDMKHNGLRKRLDVLGFSQPLPLGAVPLVGAILEDLIRTTESLKQQKDQVHTFLQEKNAWELGVEAYKCDNSKLLSEVSVLNKQLIQQKDHYEAKKCEFSRRIRNLEMDKNYLETHLQELGERFEELESKYQDVLDPKRKASRKPFVSTVRSGSLIGPPIRQPANHQHNPPVVCPIRCPASAMRKDLEVERDHVKQENIGMQEKIEMQSKQASISIYFLKIRCSKPRRKFLFFSLISENSFFSIHYPSFPLFYTSNFKCVRGLCIFFILPP